ncbi:MAG TPA: hypothetical protein VNV25_25760 [Gemmatimonadaceae bacterium]|jgi:hypothetical protein|nr:hypothetical protein [Gemmatimonadaceae bacterium]
MNFDRDTKDFLVAVEKSNTRMLTDMSRVLEANAKKDDDRVRALITAQRETTAAVNWLLIVTVLNFVLGFVELLRPHG